jgi:excisionase family DNA binding protein
MSEVANEGTWHSKKQIADHFGIGLRTVTDWMRRRIIPFVKVGHVVRFSLADCEIAIRKYKVSAKD